MTSRPLFGSRFLALVLMLGSSLTLGQGMGGSGGPGGSTGDPSDSPGNFSGHDGFEIERNMVFPHIAVGPDISTSLLLSSRANPQDQNWTEPGELRVSGRVYFFQQNGAPMLLRVNDGEEVSEFAFDLPPLGLLTLDLTATGENRAGWALVVVDEQSVEDHWGLMDGRRLYRAEHLDGLALYALASEDGALRSSVGVLPAVFEMQRFVQARLLAQTGPELNTGVAMLNAGDANLHLRFRLYDEAGDWTGLEKRMDLEGGHQIALFVDQIFDELQPQGFRGTLLIEADQTGLVTLGLLQSKGLLTALPAQHYGSWQQHNMMP